MQSSSGVRLRRGVWCWGERTWGTGMCVDGWEVGNKSGVVQWCSAIWWEAHFSCVVRPHTGRVIRAAHLAPLPPESGTHTEKLDTLQLVIVVMISQGMAQVFVDELLLFYSVLFRLSSLPSFLSSILFLLFFIPSFLFCLSSFQPSHVNLFVNFYLHSPKFTNLPWNMSLFLSFFTSPFFLLWSFSSSLSYL